MKTIEQHAMDCHHGMLIESSYWAVNLLSETESISQLLFSELVQPCWLPKGCTDTALEYLDLEAGPEPLPLNSSSQLLRQLYQVVK